jgi:hypothetical protein
MTGAQYGVQAGSKELNEVNKRMMDYYANMAPTITIPAGAPMKIYFSEDVLLNGYMSVDKVHWVLNPVNR